MSHDSRGPFPGFHRVGITERGDTRAKYCRYCTNEASELKSWEEAVEGMTNFIIKTQEIEREQAKKMAMEGLAKMPA